MKQQNNQRVNRLKAENELHPTADMTAYLICGIFGVRSWSSGKKWRENVHVVRGEWHA